MNGPNTTEHTYEDEIYHNNNNDIDNEKKWNGKEWEPYKQDTPHCNLSAMSNQFHTNRKKKKPFSFGEKIRQCLLGFGHTGRL